MPFSIDSAQTRDALLMGWGWYLSNEAGNRSIELEIRFFDGIEQTIRCLTNRARDDVAQAFPANPRAPIAGFIFLSSLASRNGIQKASLLVSLDNGDVKRHPLQEFPERFAPDSIATQVVLTRIRTAWRLAKLGRFAFLRERLRRALQRLYNGTLRRSGNKLLPQDNLELLFDHRLGGGTNKYREEKIVQLLQLGKVVVLVTFDLPRLLYRIEIHQRRGKQHETFENIQDLQKRLSQTHYAAIHVNNFVSYPNPLAMLKLVKQIVRQDNSQLTVYLHDFHFVCPSYTLISAEGSYCGIPDAGICRKCLKTNDAIFPSFSPPTEIAPWREAWDELLRIATNIVAFSESTVEIFQQAFPVNDWRGKVTVQPHLVDLSRYPKIRAQIQNPLKIAVIGNIHFAKGAEIVHEILVMIAQQQLPFCIVVIGTLERFTPSPALTVTGPFENSRLPALLQHHEIGVCLLPSICPETFSYVTEEIMTMEMPLVCFDLGAPASRVRRYRLGEVATEISANGALDAIMSLVKRMADAAP